MNSEMWWYSARVGGVVAGALLAGALLAGMARPIRILAARVAATRWLGLQRTILATALAFTGVHLIGSVLAEQVNLDAADVLVPLHAPEHSGALAWGWVATALVIAVAVASIVSGHTDQRVWFVAHVATLVAFIAGTAHALRVSGPDVDHPVVWWATAVGAATLVGATVARLTTTGNPFVAVDAVEAPTTPHDSIEREVERRERAITAQLRGDADRPDSALLERTLAGLRSLDAHAAPVSEPSVALPAASLPLPPSQVVSGSLFPSTEDLHQVAGPLDLTVLPGFREQLPESAGSEGSSARERAVEPTTEPSPALGTRGLPVRTPRRLARTTAPAQRLDAWQPARATTASCAGPPAPPTAIDPVTGEPDPTAYRQWLKDWLAYVESQD